MKNKNSDNGIVSKSGIRIAGDIYLRCEKQHNDAVFLPLRILLAFCSALFTLMLVRNFTGNSVRVGTLIYHCLICSVSLGAFASKFTIVRLCGGIMAFIELCIVVVNRSAAVSGFYISAEKYMQLSGMSPGSWASHTIGIDTGDYKYIYYFYAMLALILCAAAVLSCVYRIEFPILFIFTFPLFEIGMYQGMECDTFAVTGLVVCWIILLSMHIINHTTNRAGKKNTYAIHERSKTFYFTSGQGKAEFYPVFMRFTALLGAAVFTVVILASAVTGFVRPEAFTRLRVNLHNAISRLDISNLDEFMSDLSGGSELYGVTAVGGTNGGVLGKTKGIKFNGTTALTVTSVKFNSPLYLKGYVAGDYHDNTWTPFEEDEESDVFNKQLKSMGYYIQDYNYLLRVNALDITGNAIDQMDIKVRGACPKFVYAPYDAFYSSPGGLGELSKPVDPFNDSYVRITKSQKSYSVDYYRFEAGDWLNKTMTLKKLTNGFDTEVRRAMNSYYDYVYSRYTQYPKLKGLEQAYNDILVNYLDGSGVGRSYDEIYQAIKDYFSDNYKYDLTPGETPEGKDFIDYFLTEQKVGYCSYYATAGAQLLRMFGYPARYTEGYMILPSQQTEDVHDGDYYRVAVPDKCAHAWAEVFINGVGWVPAEFTPGYSNDNPNLTNKEKGLSGGETTTTTTTAPKATAPAQTSPKATTTASATSKGETTTAATTTTVTTTAKGKNTGKGTTTSEKGAPVRLKAHDLSPMTKTVLFTLLGIGAMAAAIVINRRVKLKKLKLCCTQQDMNRRVEQIFVYSLKYLELTGVKIQGNLTDIQLCDRLVRACREKLTELAPEKLDKLDRDLGELADLALKAGMSENEISAEEAQFASQTMKFIADEITAPSLSAASMLAARYIKGLY
ncbi:MAG: transglutaminase domain-containing protein [Ruminococcus sp.]|nr:transglutaminase domain-containing protein [Ruminococcus sp.]